MRNGGRVTKLGILLLLLTAGAASAQDYPSKAVRIIVPFSAGGMVDNLTRVLAANISKNFPQPIVVENKPGAFGKIGTTEVARAAPDGYTMLMVFDQHALYPHLREALPYDPLKAFSPITLLVKAPIVAVASAKLPANDLRELIAYAKANPGKVSYGSVGPGSSPHLATSLFERATGITMLHIPYKGGAPGQADLLGGHLDLWLGTTAFAQGAMRSGKVKVLGQFGQKRSVFFPDLPTAAEQGISGVESYGWLGLAAPAGTDSKIIERWRSELARASKEEAVLEKLNALGLELELSTPENFGKFIEFESQRWGQVLRQLNVVLE